jgi:putative thiamine transport system permease protein
VLLLGLSLAAIAAWIGAERAAARLGRAWAASGRRGGAALLRAGAALLPLSLLLAFAALAALLLWSVAGPWRFPDALPERLQLDSWAAQAGALAAPAANSLLAALLATGIALLLAVAALEARARHGAAALPWLLALTPLPLLLPQAGFLLGVQAALLTLGLEGGLAAVVLAHLVFVLPYVLLSLSGPWAALDPRLARVAGCLGASRLRVFLAVTLPVLARPLLVAAAVGIAVSIAQYLPTLLAGGGRFATLTTEAVTLSAGGDRRVLGVFAAAQAAIPLLAFGIALLLPALLWRRRAGLTA